MPVLRSSSANARSLHRLCDSCMAQRNLAARDLSAHHEPQRHFLPDVAVSVSQRLQAWFDIGSQPVRSSTRGRSSARLRLSGPPGGPPPRSRLLGRSSKGVAKPYQCVERSYGNCCARMERCRGHVCRGVVTTSITRSRRDSQAGPDDPNERGGPPDSAPVAQWIVSSDFRISRATHSVRTLAEKHFRERDPRLCAGNGAPLPLRSLQSGPGANGQHPGREFAMSVERGGFH
jgi:hypothetical protein